MSFGPDRARRSKRNKFGWRLEGKRFPPYTGGLAAHFPSFTAGPGSSIHNFFLIIYIKSFINYNYKITIII